MYKQTTYYEKRLQKKKEAERIVSAEEKRLDIKMMSEVFCDQYVVHNGPFQGMKYLNESSGSALLPKVLGSYEEPIHEWIFEVLQKKGYRTILDIGCAEGYYAVGFASKLPKVKVIAYDIDQIARENTEKLKELNEVQNIEIKSECSLEELNEQTKHGEVLVFCDIEGFEKVLLNPVLVTNLKYADLIVETHDWLIPNITEELVARFYETHTIEIRVDYPFRLESYSTPKKIENDVLKSVINERRPVAMKFLYCKSRYNNG